MDHRAVEDAFTVLAQESPPPRRLGLEGEAFDRAAIGLAVVFLTGLAVIVGVLSTRRRRARGRECAPGEAGSPSSSAAPGRADGPEADPP